MVILKQIHLVISSGTPLAIQLHSIFPFANHICISRKWNRMHHNQSTLNCTTTRQTHDHIENLQKNYNFFRWNWVGILCDRHFKPIHIHAQNSAHKTTRRNRHLPVCRTHGITLWIYGEFSLLILIHRQFSLSELSICVWWTLFTSSSESGEYCKIISKETWRKEETYTKKNNETTDKKWCAPEWLSDSLSGNLHAYHHQHSHTQNTWNSNNSRSQRDSQQNISTRQTIVVVRMRFWFCFLYRFHCIYIWMFACVHLHGVYRILSQYREPKPWIDQQSQQYKPTRRYSSRGKHTTYGLHALHFACVYYLYCVSIVYIYVCICTQVAQQRYTATDFKIKIKRKHNSTHLLGRSLTLYVFYIIR